MIFIDDRKFGMFEVLGLLDVLVNFIQVDFACSCAFGEKFSN